MTSRTSQILLALAALATLAIPGSALSAGDADAGKATYMTNCQSCHGDTGKGDGPVGAVLTPSPRDFSKGEFKFDTDSDGESGTDVDLKNVIKKGGLAYDGSPLMAAWPALSDSEVDNLVAFIRSLKQ